MPLVSLLWAGALSILVEGDTRCPQPGEVAAQLEAVAPANQMAGKAVLTEGDGSLRVRLVRDNGSVVGERVLDSRYPCRDLAEAVALVLASWQGKFGARPVAAPTLARATAAPPPRLPPWLEIGVGLAAAGPRPLAAGAALSLALHRGAWGLGIQLLAVDFHRDPVDESGVKGQISWNRSPVSLTLRRRFESLGGFLIAAEAGVTGAVLLSRSQGFAPDFAAWALDFGPMVGVQVAYDAEGQVQPFISIASTAWLQPRVVALPEPAPAQPLPKFDSWLVLGLRWRPGAH